jgi:hypothetical protein
VRERGGERESRACVPLVEFDRDQEIDKDFRVLKFRSQVYCLSETKELPMGAGGKGIRKCTSSMGP